MGFQFQLLVDVLVSQSYLEICWKRITSFLIWATTRIYINIPNQKERLDFHKISPRFLFSFFFIEMYTKTFQWRMINSKNITQI